MTTEQPKPVSPQPNTPEQSSPASSASTSPQFPHLPGGFAPALPAGYPPFFAYPPPADGQQAEGTPAALPFPLLYPPPGMIYAFPPPVPAAAQATSAEASRPKRRQVKMACTNCAAACKRCDEARPCERCKKYGVADTCVDGQRKERKKGIKRGPYKRKTKPSAEDKPEDTSQPSEGGDWPQGSPTPPSTTPAPSAAPQPTVQFPPEGFYPIYIPPGYPLPDLQSSADGSASTVAPALVPIYIGGFAPYGYPPGAIFQFPPAGTHPPPPPASQAPTTEAGTVPAVGKGSEASIEATSRGSSGTAAEVSTTKDDQDEAKSDENTKVPSAAAAAGPVTND